MIELATTAGTSFEATTPPRGETQFGVAAGVVLNHAAFGFTSSWRRFITAGRGDGLRAQMLMLMLTCAVFFPRLRHGHIFGQTVRGAVSPLSVSVVVGAFLFGPACSWAAAARPERSTRPAAETHGCCSRSRLSSRDR